MCAPRIDVRVALPHRCADAGFGPGLKHGVLAYVSSSPSSFQCAGRVKAASTAGARESKRQSDRIRVCPAANVRIHTEIEWRRPIWSAYHGFPSHPSFRRVHLVCERLKMS